MIARIVFTLLLLSGASAQAAEITIVSKTPTVVLVDGHIDQNDDVPSSSKPSKG
jgi:hypothetical protein